MSSPAFAEPPNIVLIVADDLGYGDLSCYGARNVDTPVLDRLASQGARLTSFYANAPECTPTRAALMSGRYQQRIGGLECAIGTHNVGRYDDAIRLCDAGQLGLPVSDGVLPRLLKEAGYRCGLFGKWHLGYEDHFRPQHYGFEKTFGVLGGNVDYFRHTESDGWNTLFEDGELIERDGYMTTLITDAALEWYDSVKDGRFFLYVPYTVPHTPIQGPDDDTGELVSEKNWNRGTRAKYAEMVEHMDTSIGRVLKAIEADGLAEDTLVIFMSDNGGTKLSDNGPFRGTKGGLFEGGIRVPCIVRWPDHVQAGYEPGNVAITMDFTRSLLRIAGVIDDSAPNVPLDGIDIVEELENETPPRSRTLFWRARRGDRTWRAVRDGSWKLVTKTDGDEREEYLFNLRDDPGEQHNLWEDQAGAAERLTHLLGEWEQDVTPRR